MAKARQTATKVIVCGVGHVGTEHMSGLASAVHAQKQMHKQPHRHFVLRTRRQKYVWLALKTSQIRMKGLYVLILGSGRQWEDRQHDCPFLVSP